MKRLSVSIIILSSFLLAGNAFAETRITGDIFGQVFGTMSMTNPLIPYEVTIEDLDDPTENCDTTAMTCLIKGFSWSDIVGWTYWDGETMQTELGGPASFPDEYQSKTTFNGNLSGFAWGEKYGWIQLSACNGYETQAICEGKSYCRWTGSGICEASPGGRVPAVASQNINDWGAYIDFCPLRNDQLSCESAESNAYCNWDAGDGVCIFDAQLNPQGQPIRGYAWSQYLGWVKFSPETGDLGFAGAKTNWFPDLTPPTPLVPNPDPSAPPGSMWDPESDPLSVWIPVEQATGIVQWLQFAQDPDSFIDLIHSTITVAKDPSADFIGCSSAVPEHNGNLVMTREPNGEIDLHIPAIGKFISSPPYGFCKFDLSGVLYNGSGIGFYFGDQGAALATAKGINLASPNPNIYAPANITLYVRAGDISPASTVTFTGTDGESSLADGAQEILLNFQPKDFAGNPIVPVKVAREPGDIPEPDEDLWVRDFSILYNFDTASDFAFDQLEVTRNLPLVPAPVKLGLLPYLYSDPLLFPLSGTVERLDPPGGIYELGVVAYAPTNTGSPGGLDQLVLGQIDYVEDDYELYAVSLVQGPWPADATLQSYTSAPLPHSFDFQPVLEVTAGDLNSDFIALEQPLQASFTLRNNSLTDDLTLFSVDNILNFRDSGGIGTELLETRGINLSTISDESGRSHPETGESRYQLFTGNGTAQINQFHSDIQNYHSFVQNFDSALNTDGIYDLPGEYYVAEGAACLLTPPCDPVPTDRTDELGFSLNFDTSNNFAFDFTPGQIIGQAPDVQVSFDIDQYLSYRLVSSIYDQYAIYPATPFINGVDVKSIGLDTSGTVSGSQIYETISGRDLETVSTVSSAKLRREIRQNVAVLTRTMDPSVSCVAPLALTQLSITANDCIAVDETNKTVVAYYTGAPASNLTLDSAGNTLTVPAGYKYTLILDGGANLDIKDNIIYGDSASSFGIIVIQDIDGNGANVFVSPEPTNIVGLLYAEGSLLSSPDGGSSFYYDGVADVSELKNQLLWQGSIASRNTIGGAPNRVTPDNVSCASWGDNPMSCSQAYDLDYLRRFTTTDGGSGSYAPATYLFSGGGSCVAADPAAPVCTHGPLGVALSTISIDSNGFIELPPASKSLNTFYIERDNRPVPPGFSSSGGLTSSQEIR